MGVLAFVATVTLLCCAAHVPEAGAVLGDSVGAAGVGQTLWGWGRGHTHSNPVASGIASSCAFHGEATTAWEPETTASPCPHPRSKRGRQEIERLLSVPADEFMAQVYERQYVGYFLSARRGWLLGGCSFTRVAASQTAGAPPQ